MSKVLIVVGSRREGNSYFIANRIKENLRKDRIIADIIVPGNQKIYVCTGCMDCDESGICDFKDDMQKNIEKILAAETIIFITPVRWNILSSDLKVFMDRLNPLYVPKKLKGKKAVLISIGAKELEQFSEDFAITSLNSFCDSAEMKVIGKYTFGQCTLAKDIEQQTEKIDQMIQELKTKLSK